MNALPKGINDAIEAMKDLPGIGSRSAERLVLTMLRSHSQLDKRIGQTLTDMRETVAECAVCCHLTNKNVEINTEIEKELCQYCKNDRRQKNVVCVVESPLDVLALERTETYRGVYHVLHGVMSPMNRIRPEDVRLAELFHRVQTKRDEIEEIIFALPANTDGEATTLYIQQKIQPFFTKKLTRLARGIPSGGVLDFVDAGTLQRAVLERTDI